MDSNRTQSLLFEHRLLPDGTVSDHWRRIFIPDRDREMLLRYVTEAVSGEVDGVAPLVGGFSRFVIFVGPPGTGKSALALGLADQVARRIPGGISFWQLNCEGFFSKWEGESARLVKDGFGMIRLASGKRPVVVLVDELESLAFARRKLINAADPSDLTRAVDTLLRGLDELRQSRRVLVIATTNYAEAVDQAAWDRADLKVRFTLPSRPIRAAILADTFAEFRSVGLRLDQVDADALSEVGKGISGRLLRKAVWMAGVLTGKSYSELSRADVEAAIEELLLQSEQDTEPRTTEGVDSGDVGEKPDPGLPSGA